MLSGWQLNTIRVAVKCHQCGSKNSIRVQLWCPSGWLSGCPSGWQLGGLSVCWLWWKVAVRVSIGTTVDRKVWAAVVGICQWFKITWEWQWLHLTQSPILGDSLGAVLDASLHCGFISHNGQCHWQCHSDSVECWQVWHGQQFEKWISQSINDPLWMMRVKSSTSHVEMAWGSMVGEEYCRYNWQLKPYPFLWW